jgi:hypothetical protein
MLIKTSGSEFDGRIPNGINNHDKFSSTRNQKTAFTSAFSTHNLGKPMAWAIEAPTLETAAPMLAAVRYTAALTLEAASHTAAARMITALGMVASLCVNTGTNCGGVKAGLTANFHFPFPISYFPKYFLYLELAQTSTTLQRLGSICLSGARPDICLGAASVERLFDSFESKILEYFEGLHSLGPFFF